MDCTDWGLRVDLDTHPVGGAGAGAGAGAGEQKQEALNTQVRGHSL